MNNLARHPERLLLILAAYLVLNTGCADQEQEKGRLMGGSYDFISHLGESRITVRGNPIVPLQFLRHAQPWTTDERLFCPAPNRSEIRFPEVLLSKSSRLRVGFGLKPGTPDLRDRAAGMSIHFFIELTAGGGRHVLLDRTLDLATLEPGRIEEAIIDLPETGAELGSFLFRSEGPENAPHYHPVWCGPVLLSDGRRAVAWEQVTTFHQMQAFVLDHSQPEKMDSDNGLLRVSFDEETQSFIPDEQGRLLMQDAPADNEFELTIPENARLTVGLATLGSNKTRGSLDFEIEVDGKSLFRRTILVTAAGTPTRVNVGLQALGGKTVNLVLRSVWKGMGSKAPDGVAALWIHPRIEQAASMSRQRTGHGKNVLLLVVDALRADHLSCYGHERPTSPNLDALARESVLFENAWSQSSWTVPSTATLFTGEYSYTHGMYDVDHWWLVGGLDTLARRFLEQGMTTAGFVANPLISEDNDFSLGFELFQETPYATAAQLNRSFLNWLDDHPDDRFFTYIHYMEPHLPYAAPGNGLNRFGRTFTDSEADPDPDLSESILTGLEFHLKGQVTSHETARTLGADHRAMLDELVNLYDSEIAYWDERFGMLLEELAARGKLDDTIIVITSDHGEEFLDHGFFRHGQHLHRELLHVPLIIANSGKSAARRTELAGLIDVAPTLLALAEMEESIKSHAAKPGFAGIDLFDPAEPRTLLYAETAHGLGSIDAETMFTQRAAFSEDWKALHVPGEDKTELFDLITDSLELRDISVDRPDDAQRMKRLIDDWVENCRLRAPYHLSLFDASALEKLRQMGYVR